MEPTWTGSQDLPQPPLQGMDGQRARSLHHRLTPHPHPHLTPHPLIPHQIPHHHPLPPPLPHIRTHPLPHPLLHSRCSSGDGIRTALI